MLLALLLTLLPGAVTAQAVPPLRAVIILMGPVTPEQLWNPDLVNVSTLANSGSKGLMNVATGGGPSSRAGYLTLGAGTPAKAAPVQDPALNRHELWWDNDAIFCWQRRLGEPDPGTSILHLGISQLQQLNEGLAPIGVLGDVLRTAGKQTLLLGNADGGDLHRDAVLMAMTSRGTVALGSVGTDMLLEDISAPFGVRTDYQAMLSYVDREGRGAEVLFIHAGDVERALRYKALTSPAMGDLHLRRALTDLDLFIDQLQLRAPLESSWWAILPAYVDPGNAPLVPVILAGPHWSGDLLQSATTQRAGLITNTDILPSLLAHLQLAVPASSLGQALTSMRATNPDAKLHHWYLRATRNFQQRTPILQTYVTIKILLVLLTIGAVLLGYHLPCHAALLFITIALLPLVSLVWPWLPWAWPWTFSIIALLSLLATALCYLLSQRRWEVTLGVACALVTVGLGIDLQTTQALLVDTPFGYSTAIGARYYGLGNEYMGYLIGSAIMGSAVVLQCKGRSWWWLCAGWLGLVGWLVAGPGINFGGSLTLLGATIIFFGLALPNFNWRPLWVPAALVLTGLLVNALLGRGHVGAAWARASSGDLSFFNSVLQRKVAVSLRLLRWTVWSQALLTSLGGYAILSWRPRGQIAALRRRSPYIQAGTAACAAASLLALFTNDSGIVAAATIMIPAITGLLCALVITDRPTAN